MRMVQICWPCGPLPTGVSCEKTVCRQRVSDGDEEPDVDRQDVLGGVREPLDDLADLLEDLGAVVGPELGLAGAQDGDLLAVPVGGAGPAEDPLDEGLLGGLLALGHLGVAGDVVALPLEARTRGRSRPAVSSAPASSSVVAIVGIAPGPCRRRFERFPADRESEVRLPRLLGPEVRGARPPSNIVSIMAVRRFMPGASLPVWPGPDCSCGTPEVGKGFRDRPRRIRIRAGFNVPKCAGQVSRGAKLAQVQSAI